MFFSRVRQTLRRSPLHLCRSDDGSSICTYSFHGLPDVRHDHDQKALCVSGQRLQDACLPDKYSFANVLLSACSKQKDLGKGKLVHALAVLLGFDSALLVATAILNMYGKCGTLDDARFTFQEFPQKDVVSWNTIIATSAQNGHELDCLPLFRDMHEQSVLHDTCTAVSMLSACASMEDLITGQCIHACLDRSGFRSDITLDTALVNMYSKCHSLGNAQQVFDMMVFRDIVTWNTMISGHARYGYVNDAFCLFSRMLLQEICPNKITFVSVIDACASSKSLIGGQIVYFFVLFTDLEGDVVLGSALVDMYCKCNNLSDALHIFHSLPERNLITWNSMIAGYVSQGHEGEALRLFRDMQRHGINPDRITWNTLLDACANSGRVAEGELIYDGVIKAGLDCDSTVAASAVKFFGNIQVSYLLLKKSSPSDVIAWNSLLTVNAQHGRVAKACKLLHKMHELGMIAEIPTIVDLLGACVRQAAVIEGQWIHSILVILGFDMDVLVVNTLIRMYGKLGSLEDAGKLFDEIPVRNPVSWASMIASYAHCGYNERAVECFYRMHKENASFDNVVFIHLLGACAREEFLCAGREFHVNIVYLGFDSDNMVSNAIINMYCKCGDLRSAKRVFDMMAFRDAVSWNTMVTVYAEKQNWTEALQCLGHMKWEGVTPDEITFIKVLSAGANTASDAGILRWVHQCTIIDGGFEASMAVISALVDLYGKWGMLQDAHRLFNSMPEKNTEAWNAMILGYTEQGSNAEAVQLFLQMQTEGVHLENSVYVSILNAFSSPSVLLHGKRLHACISSVGILSEIMVVTALLSMYGRCGSLEDSFALFSIMKERDRVSWNALMGAFLESESYAWVLQLFERMLGEAILPNSCTTINVLQACTRCDMLVEGRRLHACVSHGLCAADIGLTNTLLSMYGESSELNNLHRLFDECPECDTISWNVMIKALVHAGHSQEGLQKFSQMQAEGFLPDILTFVNILDACGSLGILSQGKSVHTCVVHSGFAHVTVNNALLNMYSKCGHLQDALGVFTDMPERNGASWTGIISAHCQWADGRKFFELFDRVLSEEHPNFRIFASLLCACATGEALFEGKLLHNLITCLGYEQEVLIGNALINMYGKCGNYEEAKAVFENMCKKSVVTWNTMMMVDSFRGLHSERSLLFDAMIQSVEIIPNEITFMSLLEYCASIGASTRGKLLHMYIAGSAVEADLMVTTSLVSMYGKLGLLEDALKVFNNATSKSLFTWNAMIAAHMYHGQSKEALLLLLRMEHEGHTADGATLASVLTACSHCGILDEGQFFLLHIFLNNLTDMKHLDCAIDLFARTRQVIQAENLICVMPVQPTIIAWTAILGASRDLGDLAQASCAAAHVIELEPENTASLIILSNMQLAAQVSERW